MTTGDWEVDPVQIRYAVALSECDSENVKRASESVQVGADLSVVLQRQKAFFDRYYQIMRGVRIQIFDRYANVVLHPCIKPLLQGWEIGYGPINRRARVQEVIPHD